MFFKGTVQGALLLGLSAFTGLNGSVRERTVSFGTVSEQTGASALCCDEEELGE